MESCCTCATLLSEVPRQSNSEKSLPPDRRLACCPRVICGNCIHNNPRFQAYCPYCQISSEPSSLPPGLKDPPSYTSIAGTPKEPSPPPPYNFSAAQRLVVSHDEKSVPLDDEPADDTLHFLDHGHDTITSLSLRYGVPAAALRRTNNITSDHLLPGRKTIVIPGEYYKGGVSLSPRPVDGEEEELRKSKIRRFMVGCKVAEYDVAVLYLEQAAYNLDLAAKVYLADEEWERAHPVEGKGKSPAQGSHRGRSGLLGRQSNR